MALLGAAASLPFSCAQESEADHIGLVSMASAGYDPREAVAFWRRMLRASKGKEPPEFASDRPSNQHRIERVQGWLPEAERAYKAPQPAAEALDEAGRPVSISVVQCSAPRRGFPSGVLAGPAGRVLNHRVRPRGDLD